MDLAVVLCTVWVTGRWDRWKGNEQGERGKVCTNTGNKRKDEVEGIIEQRKRKDNYAGKGKSM